MTDNCCALCGKDLPKGSLKYIVRINIMSDFDGCVACSDDNPSEEIQELLEDMDSIGEGMLEEDTCQELSIYLCIQCKKRFARDLVSGEEEDFYSPKNDVGTVYH